MHRARTLPLILGAFLTACGGTTPTKTGASLDLETGSFDVPAGDSLTCIYTNTITDHEIYVGNATGKQGPGGHHILVYYSDTTHPAGHHPCVDSEMLTWHQIAGADTNKEPIVSLPDGAAVKVPAGKQIVIQSHYINTSGATQTVDDTASVELKEEKDIKQFLNFFALVDAQFLIPPQTSYKSVTTCTVPSDLNSVLLLGHMHELGKHYTLEEVDAAGNTLSTVYDTEWSPAYTSHPPLITKTLDSPIPFKAGTRFRQTCEWDNTTAQQVSFPTEMCVSFMFYFPDQGFIECDGKPSM